LESFIDIVLHENSKKEKPDFKIGVKMPRGMGWGRGRRRKMRFIGFIPEVRHFYPAKPPFGPPQPPIFMTYEEFEALRLVDYEGLTQEEAGQRMGVSRGTVWRALSSARKKVAQMLVEGRELIILAQGNEVPKVESSKEPDISDEDSF